MYVFRARWLFLVPMLIVAVASAMVAPVALLLAAPWLAVFAWFALRRDVNTGDAQAFPSAAEDAQRRLFAR